MSFWKLSRTLSRVVVLYTSILFIGVSNAQNNTDYGISKLIKTTQSYSKEQGFRGTLKWPAYEEELENLKRQMPLLKHTQYGKIDNFNFHKLEFIPQNPEIRVVVFAGVHGNEILGPIIALELLKFVYKKPIALTIYPSISPYGLINGTRRVRDNIDLNRSFSTDSEESEVQALIRDLEGQSFDLAFDIHGAPTKHHFFVIRADNDDGLATRSLMPIDETILLQSNDGKYPGKAGTPSDPERYTLYSPGVAESLLPKTLKHFIYSHGVKFSYTSEYPGRMDPTNAIEHNISIFKSFIEILKETKNRL